MRQLSVILLLFLSFSVSVWAESTASEDSSFQYTGFRQGQMGVAAVLGMPAGFRVQRFLSWRSALFVSGGYSIDKYVMADANYSYYVLAQEDPWDKPGQVGYILYNLFAGVTAGFPLSKDDVGRLGLRGGAAFEYLLPNSSWTLRAEAAPVLYLSGGTAAGFQSGLVVTYYFDDIGGKKEKPNAGPNPQLLKKRTRSTAPPLDL